jgi:pimeloyl-ACP methyl ester carboxylesterase
MSDSPTVVLVHGAFADASGFAAIIHELESDGLTVRAPANPLRSLTTDSEALAAYVGAIEGPVVLVGHSYGGAVITQASASLDNVVGLVYLAAFALEVGEDCLSVQAPFAPTMLGSTARTTSYDAVGSPGGPDITIDYDGYHETFAADLPADVARVMAVTQRAVAAAALGEAASAAGWKTRPSWYLVSEDDNSVSPDAQRFFAERMGATTESIAGSHVAFIAQPAKASALIKKAVAAVS